MGLAVKIVKSALVLAAAAAVLTWALTSPPSRLRFVEGSLALSSQGRVALPTTTGQATSLLTVHDRGTLDAHLFLELASQGPVEVTVRRAGRLVYQGRATSGAPAGPITAQGQAGFSVRVRRLGPGPASTRLRFTATAP